MNRIIELLGKVLTFLSAVVLAVMLGITALQVFLRYVFNNPTIWSEELTLFLLVWFGFLVMAIGVKDDSHIALEYFYDKQGKRGRMFLDLLRFVLIFVLSIMMIFFSVQMIKLGWNNKMPATQIRRGYLYASSLVGGCLFALFSFFNILNLCMKRNGAGDER